MRASQHTHGTRLPQPLLLTLSVSPALSRLAVLLVAAFLVWVGYLLLGERLRIVEEQLGGVGWTLAPDLQVEERVTIVAIDEKSLAQIGPWPWPRDVMAELAAVLDRAGASLQIYDVVFPELKPGDERLQQALLATPSVIAQIPLLRSSQSLQAGVMSDSLAGLRCQPPMPSTPNYLANNSLLGAVSKGHITPLVDSDGVVRHLPPLICVEGQVYPTLALSALLKAAGEVESGFVLRRGSGLLAPAWMLSFSGYPGMELPLDERGGMRISYGRDPSVYQVIPAVDLLNGNVDTRLLRNTWALIGATAFGLGDVRPTPHSGLTPGVEIQARIITSLLDGRIPYTPRLAPVFLALLAGLFGLVLYMLASRRNRLGTIGLPLMGLLLPLGAFGLHLRLLDEHIWLGWLSPALFALLATVLLSLLEQGRVRLERMRLYGNLSSYLPGEVAQEIAFNLPSGAVDVERRELTLLCADLRNFSAYEESRPPEESAALLHCFFVRATDIIEQSGGAVHEFKGDALLATWPDAGGGSAVNALAAAKRLQRMAEQLLPRQVPDGLVPLALGVGIEQGAVLVGPIGPARRRTHTLLGEAVTITLRIQEMTEALAQPILVGERAARHLAEKDIQTQGDYLLAGLRTPHHLFAPRDSGSDGTDSKESPSLQLINGGRS